MTLYILCLPAAPLVPIVQVKAVDGVSATVGVALGPRPHGVLVHGRVGLGCCVVTRRQTVAGLAAVIAVPVIYSTVLVIQSCDG